MNKHSVLLVGDNHWLTRALQLLLESHEEFAVVGVCPLHRVYEMTARTAADFVLFLPEISFASVQDTLLQLHASAPLARLVLITPAEAALYKGFTPAQHTYSLISHSEISTHLVPLLRQLGSRAKDTQHE
jgi:CMP-N-acetylneuraminic acid synthetase